MDEDNDELKEIKICPYCYNEIIKIQSCLSVKILKVKCLECNRVFVLDE